MRIIRMAVHQVDIPIRKTFRLADGSSTSMADVTIVKLVSDLGLDGWGEITSLREGTEPGYGEAVRAAIEGQIDRVLGWHIRDVDDISRGFDDTPPHHAHAWSAIDVAAWDLLAKSRSVAAYEILGGMNRPHIATGSHEDAIAVSIADSGGLTGAARLIRSMDDGSIHIGESAGTIVGQAASAHLAMSAPPGLHVTIADVAAQNHFQLGERITTTSGDHLTVSPQVGVINEPNLGVLGFPIAVYEP